MFKPLLLIISLLLPFTVMAEEFVAGKDYDVIKGAAEFPANQQKITVTEFFSYGCPWCYRIEPAIAQWVSQQSERVHFTRVPVVFNKDWVYYAKAYYTVNLLGLDSKLNPLLFKTIQNKQSNLNNNDAMIDFFTKQGVDKATAESAFKHSTTIDMQINQGTALMTRFHVTAVPAFVINEKYKTDLQMAQGEQRLLKILTFLLNESRKTQ